MNVLPTLQSRCQLGVARCDITPPVGIYHRMWGAALHERATGVHRPLHGTALVMAGLDANGSPDGRQIVLSLDHCILWDRELQQLLAAVAEKADVPRAQLLVTFTHTHSAGLMDLDRVDRPGGSLIPLYLDDLAEKLAAAVRRAAQQVRPVTWVYGRGVCQLAQNRDYWDEASGQFVCGLNPTGLADDTVLVARAVDEQGQAVAALVNYACHPTTLGWENQLISPDYIGALRETVEKAIGATCVFLQGASGDLGPREGFVGDVAVADANGRQLGHAAMAAIEALGPPGSTLAYQGPVVSGATLGRWEYQALGPQELTNKAAWRVRRFTAPLPVREDLPSIDDLAAQRAEQQQRAEEAAAMADEPALQAARAMIERVDRQVRRLQTLGGETSFALPVTIVENGDAAWVFVEGEAYNILQRALRARFPQRAIIVCTLANGGRPGYLVPAGSYGRGLYQESVAMLAPGSLEQLIEAVAAALASASQPEALAP